jgi:hypothetical protein
MAVAQQVLITVVDDINGSEEGVETVRFGLDGAEYEIDLDPSNNGKLRTALSPFVKAARPAARASRQGAARRQQSGQRVNSGEVRAWAKEQGIALKDRGRVPVEVVERFKAAHA